MNYLSQIKKIGFISLKIEMKPLNLIIPRNNWGSSAIRGALGNAMLRRHCPQQKFNCDVCRTPCNTGLLFSTAKPDHSEQAVNPYIIHCENEPISEGILRFEITFFANGIPAAADVMLALKDGITLGKENAEFQLVGIIDAITDEPLFDGFLLRQPEIHYMDFDENAGNRYCIEFLTPYRTKIPIDEFGFPQLVRAMLRRTSTILRQINIEPDFDYSALIKKSENIVTDYRLFTPESKPRYSSRTNTRWDVTGFTGAMIISGDFSDFLPLMRIAEIIGAGKLCVMGLGKIKVSVMK